MGEAGRGRADSVRWLRLFGEVRRGEAGLVVMLGLQVFLLLVAYYLLKTVREPLILLKTLWGLKGSELRTYGTAAQALLLLGLMPLYARASGGIARGFLVRGSLLVLAIVNVLFIAAGLAGLPIGVPFFIWLGIVSLLSVAQFWSLANDLLDRPTGERLFGIIAIGASLGAIAGAQLARWLIGPLGVFGLMAFAAALYTGAIPIVSAVETYARRLRAQRAPADVTSGAIATEHDSHVPRTRGPFALVLGDRYLLLLGVALLLANLVNTQGEYILADTIKRNADALPPDARTAYIGRFFGNFYSGVNAVALIFQALFVSRLIKHVGIRAMLFVLPVVAVGGYGVIALVPVLAVVAGVKLAENALDYSLLNTVRHALFLPTSRGAKYTGKAAIDTVFVRLGDLVAGGVVFAGLHVLQLSRAGFAAVNVVLAVIWLGAMAAIARRHQALVGAGDDLPGPRWRARARLAVPAVMLLVFIPWGCARSTPTVRAFPDRPVAWHEHDDADVARPPAATDLDELDITMLLRDSVAGEVDYYLTLEGPRPARDVNALDEVPCSTWFCARNHLRPMSRGGRRRGRAGRAAAAAAPHRQGEGPRRGARLRGRSTPTGASSCSSWTPPGHPGLASGAEVVGGRIFHAAGLQRAGQLRARRRTRTTDLTLDPKRHLQALRGRTPAAHRGATCAALARERARSRRPRAGRGGHLAAGARSWAPST